MKAYADLTHIYSTPAAMYVDTKARKMFGDDYLARNNQVEEPFVVECAAWCNRKQQSAT